MTSKTKQLKKGALSYAIALFLCSIVAIFRYITSIDIMSLTVFRSKILGDMTGENGVYSLWPISHFILYLFLGYLAPSWWWLWICIGIGWELFEYGCGQLVKSLQSKAGTSKLGKRAEKMFMPQYGDEWVSGTRSDIIFNITGLFIGIMLSKLSSGDCSEEYDTSPKITYYLEDSISSTSFQNYKDKDRYGQSYLLTSSS